MVFITDLVCVAWVYAVCAQVCTVEARSQHQVRSLSHPLFVAYLSFWDRHSLNLAITDWLVGMASEPLRSFCVLLPLQRFQAPLPTPAFYIGFKVRTLCWNTSSSPTERLSCPMAMFFFHFFFFLLRTLTSTLNILLFAEFYVALTLYYTGWECLNQSSLRFFFPDTWFSFFQHWGPYPGHNCIRPELGWDCRLHAGYQR